MQPLHDRDIIPNLQRGAELIFQLRTAIPDHHQEQDQQRQQRREIATVEELTQTGDKEHNFNGTKRQQHDPRQEFPLPHQTQVGKDQQRSHQHGNGNGQTVGRLDLVSAAEIQHHQTAADPHQPVHRTDVQLAFGIGRIAHFQMRQQVQMDGLGDQRIRTGDQRLRGDHRCHGTENHRHRTQALGQHLEEGVQILHRIQSLVAHIADHPGALTHIVEN